MMSFEDQKIITFLCEVRVVDDFHVGGEGAYVFRMWSRAEGIDEQQAAEADDDNKLSMLMQGWLAPWAR